MRTEMTMRIAYSNNNVPCRDKVKPFFEKELAGFCAVESRNPFHHVFQGVFRFIEVDNGVHNESFVWLGSFWR